MTYPQRIQKRRNCSFQYVEPRYPLLCRSACGRLYQLVDILRLVLDQVPPAEAEYQEDRLADGIKHPTVRSTNFIANSEGMIERVHSTGQEITENRDDVSCAFFVNESGTADETRNVTRRGYTSDHGKVFVQQGLFDQHTLEEVTELRVKRRVPKYQELRVTRFKSSDDSAIEYREECVKLGTTGRLLEFRVRC